MKKYILIISILFNTNILNANIFNDEKEAKKTGDIVQIAVPLYGLATTLYYQDFKEGLMPYLWAFASTQASVEILKRTVKEERPDKSDHLSFPSGHSAAAFLGATFIHKRYGIKHALIPYVLATYVGYSRVKSKKHHTHDVIAGALIAGGFNYFLVDKKVWISPKEDGMMVNYKLDF